MRILAVSGPHPLLAEFHADVLTPSFPPSELGPLDELDGAHVRLALDDDGRVLGGAVGDWDPELRVMLLGYLALRPGIRGGGIGGALLDDTLAAWRTEHDPCLVLAEVEDPAAHAGAVAEHGDPAARLRFYRKRGARALDIPYFQPALSPETGRVPGLFLMVLHAAAEFRAGEDAVTAAPVRSFMEGYFLETEGVVPTDPEARALWDALAGPTVALR
ncbi:GNAT family N-acetyltransferase [Longispora urticae]